MLRRGVQDERVFQLDTRDRPALGTKPAGGRELDRVEPVEGRGYVGPANVDRDRLRYPC